MNDIGRLRQKRSLWQKIVDVALADIETLARGVDADTLDELERILLEADFGVELTEQLVGQLEQDITRGKIRSQAEVRTMLGSRIRAVLSAATCSAEWPDTGGVFVTLLLGVNGTGKTTTAAKLAYRSKSEGRSVLLAATDTFRSGAQEQLRRWAGELDVGMVGGQPGADPASVAYDAAEAARARGIDHLIVDTAGRLHTQRDLMDELDKIDRVLCRQISGAPHERLLVVDATSGQNVLQQARDFGSRLDLTGLVLSKYDSTARGGTAAAVVQELGLPVCYVGLGETTADLIPFDSDRYVEKLLSS
ncbi:MAG: signal recognition particle-docking protein FtsY [Gemmatimonadota bacterium]